jgi:hypothetical protein
LDLVIAERGDGVFQIVGLEDGKVCTGVAAHQGRRDSAAAGNCQGDLIVMLYGMLGCDDYSLAPVDAARSHAGAGVHGYD